MMTAVTIGAVGFWVALASHVVVMIRNGSFRRSDR